MNRSTTTTDTAEVADIAATIAATLAHEVRRDYPPHGRPARRDAHPKHHGTVQAELIVDPDIPLDLQHGVFAMPGRRYDAWIRFSNAFRVRHDLVRDARGMALKLLDAGVDADNLPLTQDFLMVTHAAFFAANAADFLDFPAAVSASAGGGAIAAAVRTLRYFFRLRPFRWRWRAFRALRRSMTRTLSPLTLRYFSQTPYRLGPHVVKFAVRPHERPTPADRLRLAACRFAFTFTLLPFVRFPQWEHMLRDELFRTLAARDAAFDFLVQRQTDAARMPIDDATVVWAEGESPFVKVATVRVPRQALDADGIAERLAFSEHLSFSPWHALPAHEPLGSINAARRIVYDTISALRHELNGKQRREPARGETPRDYLGSV